MFVYLQVLDELVDACGEQSNLNLRGTRVSLMGLILLDDGLLLGLV